jgi:flagellar hook-associated protein 2
MIVPQGFFSIGGIASGLDTHDIINQLLQLERQPIRRVEQQKAQLSKVSDAWTSVSAKLSSLRTAVDQISRADRFASLQKVTSSNEDAVSVTASGKVGEGTLSFTVEQLATRMQRSSSDTFSGLDASIGDRKLTITVGDRSVDVTAELGPDATLADLVEAIDDSGLDVRASALQVTPGNFQLVLDARNTGTAGGFTVQSQGWDNDLVVTQQAEDARLQVGGITITRSSNTIDDLVDGARITLNATTTGPVTITSARDVEGAVDRVKGFVDALNGVFKTLHDLTAYDAESRTAGPLQGSAEARQLTTSLRDVISRPIAGLSGTGALASDLGISITREGRISFDEAKLQQAFEADFEGTAARLARSGSTTSDAATFLSSTSATQPGTYFVEITQAAGRATATGTAYTAPQPDEGRTIRITRPNGTFTDVTLTDTHQTAEDAAAHIRATLEAAGVTAYEVTTDRGAHRIAPLADGDGSAARFTVSEVNGDGEVVGDAFGLAGEAEGVDVAGTIGGQAATGTGRTLTGSAGDATGLSVQVNGSPGSFDVTWTRGVIGTVGSALSRAEGVHGTIARAKASLTSQQAVYQQRIDGLERRVELREATIRRQFNAMESMLGQLNSQGQWLSQQLQTLPTSQMWRSQR